MTTENAAVRQPGERFKSWLERVLPLIYERQTSEMTDIAGLQADADTLATVIPALAAQMTSQAAALAKDEEDLKAALAQEGLDAAQIAKLEGELGKVEAIKAQLDPIVAQASSLVVAPAAPADGGAAPADGGAAADPGAGAADPGAGAAGTGAGGV